MAQSILYYPTIDIKDGAWLRNAILYWDQVCSIVPYGHKPIQSPEIKWLEKEGIYRPIKTSESNKVFDDKKFIDEIKILTQNEKQNMRSEDKYGVDNVVSNLNNMINYNKIPLNFKEELLKDGLITSCDEEWFLSETNFLVRYMAILAKYMAKYEKADMVIGTDSNKNLGFPYRHGRNENKNMCLELLFERALPSPSLDMSFEEILDFREKHREEFLNLQGKIRGLEKMLFNSNDIREAKDVIEKFRETWQMEICRIERLLNENKIKYYFGTAKSLVQLGVPEFMNTIQNLYGSVPKWIIGVSVGAVGLIGLGRQFFEKVTVCNTIKNESAFAYLYDAEINGFFRKDDFLEIR